MKLNLRTRLLAGHILPVLLLIPLVGLALIYLLETRVFIPALANEMIDQGLLGKTGTRMGHINLSGDDGSIAAFSRLNVARKIGIHGSI